MHGHASEQGGAATVRIGSGRHEGAAIALGPAALSVGSDPACDVVLSDAGLAPLHFTMRAVEGGGAALTARGGAVRVDDEVEVEPGFRATIDGPAAIEAAGVRMELALPGPPAPRGRTGRGRRGALLPVLACAGMLIWAQDVGLAAGDLPTVTAPPVLAASARPVPSSGEAPDVAASVAAELAARGLAGIDVGGTGRVALLTGEVEADDRTEWARLQRWFDAAHPGAVLMTEGVLVRAGAPAHPPYPTIQSIWSLGTAPYALVGGSRVRPGDALPGGWVLTGIEGTSVTLRHSGREHRLDLVAAAEPAR